MLHKYIENIEKIKNIENIGYFQYFRKYHDIFQPCRKWKWKVKHTFTYYCKMLPWWWWWWWWWYVWQGCTVEDAGRLPKQPRTGRSCNYWWTAGRECTESGSTAEGNCQIPGSTRVYWCVLLHVDTRVLVCMWWSSWSHADKTATYHCHWLSIFVSTIDGPVWGRGTPLPPLSIYFLIFFRFFTFLFLSLALPIFFFCPSLLFLPE